LSKHTDNTGGTLKTTKYKPFSPDFHACTITKISKTPRKTSFITWYHPSQQP